jgi:glyoxylase-like metal-dependent hydrolase (beta-lactamase superfamily II)
MIFANVSIPRAGIPQWTLKECWRKIMAKKSLVNVILCLALMAGIASAQDAKTVLAAAEKAMGATNLKSVEYSGTGFNAALGQNYNPTSAWPKFDLKTYTRTINYADGASKEELTRVQGNNPPRGGGGTPLVGEQKQSLEVSGKYAWNTVGTNPVPQFGANAEERELQIWLTPYGFLQAAKRGNGCAINWDCEAKLSTKTEGGKKVNVISAVLLGKYTAEATLDDQNMITKIETKIPNPVLGDMPVVITYSDYKDFNGLRFPTKIEQMQGGHPTFELNVTEAKANVPAALPVPAPVRDAEAPRMDVSVQLLADGVWYLTGGTHHSLVVEFKDYTAIIEAPLNEARSEAVIAQAKQLVINKPIKYVINTHSHFDHAGGLRTYVAEGATIITNPINKAFYEQVFKAKHTMEPDMLSKKPKAPVFLTVANQYTLTDGSQKIEIFGMKNDNHNEGMLIAYLPAAKILVEADEWNPPPADAKPPATPPAAAVNLYDNIQRLKLDVKKIAPIHGRLVTMDDFLTFLGKKKS